MVQAEVALPLTGTYCGDPACDLEINFEYQLKVEYIYQIGTPIFDSGFRKSGKFYVRMTYYM